MTKGPKPTPPGPRFWAKVRKSNGCWEWIGSTNNKGYGIFPNPYGRLAHRYSWVLHGNPNPGKRFVLHNCDNSICVRPEHLRVGNQNDNMRDVLLRGRKNGKPHGRSKLVPEQVREIKALVKDGINDLSEISVKYGITPAAVGHIKYGTTWSWLD